MLQSESFPSWSLLANFLGGTHSKQTKSSNKVMLINCNCYILPHFKSFQDCIRWIFKIADWQKAEPLTLTRINEHQSNFFLQNVRFTFWPDQLVGIKLAILGRTSSFTDREMAGLWTWNVPKTAPNGHRFSTAGWFPNGHGRRDISLGSPTHTQRSFPTWVRSYICQISPNRRLPSVGPCWVFGHSLSHTPSFLHILLSCENFHWLFVGSVFFLGMLKSHLKPVLFIG